MNIITKIKLWLAIRQVNAAIKKETDMATIKKGIKTSEFYVGLVAAIIPVLNKFLGLELPTEAIISIVGLAVTYILGRSFVKKL